MRRVAAPVCEDVAVNLIVRGELTDLKSAIGKEEVEEVPTVYVVAEEEVQEDMRVSVGCMRSWEAALRKPVGLILEDWELVIWGGLEMGMEGGRVILSIPSPNLENCRPCFHRARDRLASR
jgi:hypothetical protein